MRLAPNENVEWTTTKGFFSASFVLAFLGIVCGAILAGLGFIDGEANGQPFPPIPALGWTGIAVMLVGLGYAVISFLAAKSTKYILTNQRILETRSDKIVKEIALADFMGKPVSDFFDKHAAGSVNGQPVFNVRISNPKSSSIIEFRSLNASAMEALERILERAREVIHCEYCNTSNSAASLVCSRCGAPLR